MLKNVVKAIKEGTIDAFEITPSLTVYEDAMILIEKGDKRYRRCLTKNDLSFIDNIVDRMLKEITQEDK